MSTENCGIAEIEKLANMKPADHTVTVLLAEDEPTLRQMLAFVLQAQGYHLIVAEDGRQALELAKSIGRIDVLLSDIQMPGLADPDVAQELLRSRPDLKIVLMSGCVSSVNVSRREWRFLQKPFSAHRLLEEVRTALA